MEDILFQTEGSVFSYRVAGICLNGGRVLLQKPTDEDSFAFPGGHVAFGETNEETLKREFLEEIGAEIAVGELKWVGEIFFQWGEKPCHQICLYYEVALTDERTPRNGVWTGRESHGGGRPGMEFHWISLDRLREIPVYPDKAASLLAGLQGPVQHFIYRE